MVTDANSTAAYAPIADVGKAWIMTLMSPFAISSSRLGAVVLGCATAVSALISLYTITMPLELGETIAHSRQILASFKAADLEITKYRARTGKLPSFDALKPYRAGSYDVTVVDPSLNSYVECCKEAVQALGMPPRSSYLLEVWRGQWSEYYAPWSGRSTLAFDKNEYAATGSLLLDAVLAASATLALAYGTLWFWRARERTADGL